MFKYNVLVFFTNVEGHVPPTESFFTLPAIGSPFNPSRLEGVT